MAWGGDEVEGECATSTEETGMADLEGKQEPKPIFPVPETG